MLNDLVLLSKAYLILVGLQFLGWPWAGKIGAGVARMFALLFVSLAIWFTGRVLPVNTNTGVAVACLILALAGVIRIKKKGLPWMEGGKKVFLISESLFIFGFFGLALVRGFNPDILGLEKFMDFGFIKSYLTCNHLPAGDMWLAGENINYYSFGHFMASILIRLMGVSAGVGYNLVLGVILGLSLSLSFEIIVRVLQKITPRRCDFFGGVMGALMVGLGGNSHALWYMFKNKGFEKYWYPDATRFIERTIHEFPGYSFVVSDLHGHVLNLPIVLTFILVLVGWKAKFRDMRTWLLGLLLGVMAMTNTWDLLVYGMLLGIYGLWLLVGEKWFAVFKDLLVSAMVIGGVAFLTALLWYVNFDPFGGEIKLAYEHSPLWQLVVLWGGHLIITALAVIINFKFLILNNKSNSKSKFLNVFVLALASTAIVLLVLPEFFYVKDIYSGHPRANTMFKLTYQAFILMGLLAGVFASQVISNKVKGIKKIFKTGLIMVFVLFFGGVMVYPFLAFKTFYGLGKSEYRGLNGYSWFENKYPGEAWVVWYLEQDKNKKNIAEAVGDSYTEFNAISAYSGKSTIIGWRVHEWLWRGGYDTVAEREREVREIYEGQSKELAKQIIDKYQVGFIVLGSKERGAYDVNEDKLLSLGKVVLDKSGVKLIEVY